MSGKTILGLLLAIALIGCGTRSGEKKPEAVKPTPAEEKPAASDTLAQDTTLPPGFESIHKYEYEEHKKKERPGEK